LSLMALGIGRDDEVITTPFTFIATAEMIAFLGAKPVFVDIDPCTYNLDPNKIVQAITKKTKAIIPVHLYGQSAEMDKICKITRKYSLKIIEDAAQAMGARYKGDPIGSFGHAACLSFFPAKNLGAYGDAGMVLTNSRALAEKIKCLRTHGARKKYQHSCLGINSRLDALQATILSVKLKYLPAWTRARRAHAQIIDKGLGNIKNITTPHVDQGCFHVYNQYTIRTKNRGRLQQYLGKNSIPTAVHYPLPLHLQPAFKYLGYRRGDFPKAEKAAREVLSLPIHPDLTAKERNLIIRTIKKFATSH